MHPYTIAEIGLGSLARRDEVIAQLALFPSTPVALHAEVMQFIAVNSLAGTGIGYVDAHLLAATKFIRGKFWTRDKRLLAQSIRLGIDHILSAT